MEKEEAQIQVKLVAKQDKYAIPEAPIVVPQNLQRYGLSEIVNHLLGNEKPIPFDFLANGEFLRVSIAQYLKQANESAENTLTLEYIESLLPPKEIASFSQDDWISSISAIDENKYIVGSYDGVARVWNASSQCEDELKGHESAIKCVKAVGSKIEFLSGSQDRTVIAWGTKSGQRKPLYAARGHTDTVESVDVNPAKTHFVTASADSTVKFWSLPAPKQSEVDVLDVTDRPVKRRKGRDNNIITKAAIGTLTGHIGPVSCVRFNDNQESHVFSGGWDHTVRIWDVASGVNLTTKLCDKVIIAMDYSSQANLIATGHADRSIRLWDPRTEDSTMVKHKLTSHRGFISGVKWASSSAYMLASASHDSTIKIWDIRSRTPLYTVSAAEEKEKDKKLLALDWSGSLVLTGGESGSLRIHEIKGHLE